jgi:Protein of unknown function (DUF4235)
MTDDQEPRDGEDGITFGYKVLAAVGAMVGAKLARKAATKGWRAATGHEPPAGLGRAGFAEVAAWAAVSAAAVAVAQILVRRRVAAMADRGS